MGKKDKKPRHLKALAEPQRAPRGAPLFNIPSSKFKWRTAQADHGGPYWWSCVELPYLFQIIIPRLHDFESMSWGEIEGSDHHFIDKDALCKAARDRLAELDMENIEQLFSMHVTGKQRIWGQREGTTLYVLWWDPEHEISPSPKRHT